MLRRFLSPPVVGTALIVVIIGGALGWWRHSTRPDVRLRRGQEAVRVRDFIRAEEYADLLRDAGEEDRYNLLAGEIALRQNQWRKALAHLDRIQDKGALRVEAGLLTSQCLVSLRQYRQAEGVLHWVLSQRPDLVRAHQFLAIIYYDQGDLGRAVAHLEEVARLNPADARSERMLGVVHRDREEFEEAVEAYRESLRRDPHPADEVEVRVELASCLMRLRKEEEVLQSLAGLETEAAQAVRAEALIALLREHEALAILDRGLQEHPDYGGFLRLRGERYNAAGQWHKAIALLEKMVRQVPDDFRARTALAHAYHGVGRDKDEAEQNNKVREIQNVYDQIYEKYKRAHADPWDAAVREELADLNEKIGRVQDAKMWREAAAVARGTDR